MIYFSIYQTYNNCYSLARVWAACEVTSAITELETQDIIEKVPESEATPWVSPIVAIPKKDGQVRINLVPRVFLWKTLASAGHVTLIKVCSRGRVGESCIYNYSKTPCCRIRSAGFSFRVYILRSKIVCIVRLF